MQEKTETGDDKTYGAAKFAGVFLFYFLIASGIAFIVSWLFFGGSFFPATASDVFGYDLVYAVVCAVILTLIDWAAFLVRSKRAKQN